jgi:hypothetical protein
MGYFSSIADAAFKENPEGEGWIYYPNGAIFKKECTCLDCHSVFFTV